MNILVTGAAGFIGSHLVEALLRRGDRVTGLDSFDPYYDPRRKRRNLEMALAHRQFELVVADILDSPRLRALCDCRRFEGVVHLAAKVGNRHSLAAADGDDYFRVNAGGTESLLAACSETRPLSFVFVSTGNVYDNAAPLPFREEVTPERPRTPYSRSKQEAEKLLLEAAGKNGLPATVLRLFTAYGPRQRPDMVHSRFVSSLLRDEPMTLIGSGSDLRDYIHVSDACAAIMSCLDRPTAGEVVNAGSGQATSLDSLVALLAQLTGKAPRILCRPVEANDTRQLLADIAKAGRLLGWHPRVALEDGLNDFIAWIREYDDPASKRGTPHES